uniref:Protein kinase domain-containing protein n=1 Tax=Panagrolaimus sp. ES5 TaxID=591445 RepID=A0AC34FLJ1_9BILA
MVMFGVYIVLIFCSLLNISFSNENFCEPSKCHESCKECSRCNDETACTACPDNHHKVNAPYESLEFHCQQKCENNERIAIRFYNYSYCNLTYSNHHFSNTLQSAYSPHFSFSMNLPSLIIFIFAGIFFMCSIAITYAHCFILKKTNNFFQRQESDVERSLIDTPIKLVEVDPFKEKACAHVYSNLENIDVGDFVVGKSLSSGNYSFVHEGKLFGKDVAIKVALKEGRKSIIKELQVYDKVSHQNIIKALGIHLGVENLLFMPLRKFSLAKFFVQYGATIKDIILTQYSIQVADAMKYLHSKNILHCDLKIDNILVKNDNGDQVEISDFGCAVDLDHDHEARYVGTITHKAYEHLKAEAVRMPAIAKTKSDVWAFGVTVWQIFSKTDEIPDNFINPKDIVSNYEKGKKLPKPEAIPDRLWRYDILQCFNLQPDSRPTMEEMHQKLISWSIFVT